MVAAGCNFYVNSLPNLEQESTNCNFFVYIEDSCSKFGKLFTRGGTNCPMFANCSGFGDVREVRSSVLGQIEMFGSVRSSILKFGEHFRTFWALF